MKISHKRLIELQSKSLQEKVLLSSCGIQEWYEYWEGMVYIAFSGGKDSTVLIDIVRSIYPRVPAVFVNTGLEYPEIIKFVKSIDNVIWLRPKMNFRKVIEKYGYPVISKKISTQIRKIRKAGDKDSATKNLYLTGYNREGIYCPQWIFSKKWRYLLNSEFKISEKCCDYIKKEPFKRYSKQTNRYGINAIMAYESRMRKDMYMKTGCNAFNANTPLSSPLSFWDEQDILKYILTYNIPYSKIYGNIIEENGKLSMTGEQRTGCMFCMFGVHLEQLPNRFQRMKKTHPKHYKYCIEKLKIGEILDYIDVPYK